jgi:hypothetical protein
LLVERRSLVGIQRTETARERHKHQPCQRG